MDIGVHMGEDTEFYLRKGFRVVGVEAFPPAYEAARRRLHHYMEKGQLTLLNVAIAARNEQVVFQANLDVSVWGTTSTEWAARNKQLGTRTTEITVQGQKFEEILGEFGIPYYLKVDIEGSDILCAQALREFSGRPRFFSLESTKTSWDGLVREFTLLRELGYSRFKIVQQEDVPLQVCPSPPLEGNFVAHRFESGSSGLFGEEAPGQWVPEKEALKMYKRIFRAYRLFGDDGLARNSRVGKVLQRLLRQRVGWYDTHARAEG